MEQLVKGRLWKLEVELFGAKVFCVLGDREEDWVKYIDPIKTHCKETDESFLTLKDSVQKASQSSIASTISRGKRVVLLFSKGTLDAKLIVHECVHAAYDIAKSIGVSDTNNEVEAYLTEHLFEKVSKVVLPQTNKNKRSK